MNVHELNFTLSTINNATIIDKIHESWIIQLKANTTYIISLHNELFNTTNTICTNRKFLFVLVQYMYVRSYVRMYVCMNVCIYACIDE